MRKSLLATLALTGSLAAGPPELAQVDVHGDPLPPGAVQRLGTVQHRCPPWRAVGFTPDGKSVVTLAWGKYLSVFDAQTGRRTQSRTLSGEPATPAILFRDAEHAVVIRTERRAGQERTVWEIWDLGRDARTGVIDVPSSFNGSPTVSPDGRRLACVGQEWANGEISFRLTVWDARTGTKLGTAALEPPGDAKQGFGNGPVAFSDDGRQIVGTVCTNGKVRIRCWEADGLKVCWDRMLPGQYVRLQAAPNGTVLARDGVNGRVLDGATGADIDTTVPKELVGWDDLTFTRDGSRLLVPRYDYAKDEGAIDVWDWKAKRVVGPLPGKDMNRARWTTVVPSPDGRSILLADSGLRLYDLPTGRFVWGESSAAGHLGPVTQLAFSADGRRLLTAGRDATVRLWDVDSGRPLGTWATARTRGEWDGSYPGNPFRPNLEPGIALSADGRRVAFPARTGLKEPPTLQVVDVEHGGAPRTLTFPAPAPAPTWPYGINLAAFTASADRLLVVFGEQDPNPPVVPGHRAATCDLAAGRVEPAGGLPAAHYGATAGPDAHGRAVLGDRVYHLPSGREVVELAGAGPGPRAGTPNGQLVAGVGRREPERPPPFGRPLVGDLRVWDAGTGSVVAALPWSPGERLLPAPWPLAKPTLDLDWTYPWRLALAPSGRVLATADLAGVRFWDLATGRLLSTASGLARPPLDYQCGSPATSLAFTPDGSRLATGMPDGTILFWPVPIPPLAPAKAGELPGLWADLAGPDAGKGWRAAWRLMDDPAAAVKLVRTNLKPVERVPAADVARLLADADAPEFRRREAATRQLGEIIDQVSPAVTDAQKAPGASAELQERLGKVLAIAPGDDRPRPAWAAAHSRAVAVLEHVHTSDGTAALRELARGAPGAWLTREAKAALARLATQTP